MTRNLIKYCYTLVIMKIVYFIDFFEPHLWWVETAFWKLIRGVALQWNDVSVVTSRHDQYLPHEEMIEWIQIYRKWFWRLSYFFYSILKYRTYTSWATLVHWSSRVGAYIVWFARFFSKIPTIVTIHDVYASLWLRYRPIIWRLYRLIEQLMYRLKFDHILTVSEHNVSEISKITKKFPLSMIYHWVEQREWKIDTLNMSDKAITFLYYWRSTREKWLWVLIWSLSQLYLWGYEFKAVVIAPKSKWWLHDRRWQIDHDIVSQLIDAWVLTWLDPLPHRQLIQMLSSSRCVIVPSLNEWFGFAAVQACLMGLPVVVSKAWALPETVYWRVLFANPWDSKSLKYSLVKALNWEREYIQPKSYSRDKSISKTINLYIKLTQ